MYLDEFVLRFNAADIDSVFQVLLGIEASLPRTTYAEIKEGAFTLAA